MPRRSRSVAPFTPQKDMGITYNTFNGGLNLFSRETELRPNELARADNYMLIGTGTPYGRWALDPYKGAALYSNNIGTVCRYIAPFYDSKTSVNFLLAIFNGYLKKIVDETVSIVSGASFRNWTQVPLYRSAHLGGSVYFACMSEPIVRFDGAKLIPYVGVSNPASISVAKLSGASGYSTWSWIVAPNSVSGENTGSTPATLSNLPIDLTTSTVRLTWTAVSAASGVLTGYSIYRGLPGRETLISTVGSETTTYLDVGAPQSNTTFPNTTDTTSGPRAKYILKVDDRLVLAGINGDPSKVLISARYPYHDRFTAIDGGGYCYVSPDDGDEITGIGLQHIQTTNKLIMVYKNNSTHVISLNTVSLGNYQILDPAVVTLSQDTGASSADTIIQVEQDTFSFGRNGLYSTGQEPQYLNQIRTNEISARIRPYIDSLSKVDFETANAAYIDKKYLLSFPEKKEIMVYDRQRSAFMGPWKLPVGLKKMIKYINSDGDEKWLGLALNNYVITQLFEFNKNVHNDMGAFPQEFGLVKKIEKLLRTKKEDFGEWNTMKMMKYFYFLTRNVKGTYRLNLRLEGRQGNVTTEKTTSITAEVGSGGWGSSSWGASSWGDTVIDLTISGDEVARYAMIYKYFRVCQVEVISNDYNSNAEFLGVKFNAISLGPASLPSRLKI